MRIQYKTQILVELVQIQNLYISALYSPLTVWYLLLVWKMERISLKIRSKTAFVILFVGLKRNKQACFSLFVSFGPRWETRTPDILLPKQARYQLRYTRIFGY